MSEYEQELMELLKDLVLFMIELGRVVDDEIEELEKMISDNRHIEFIQKYRLAYLKWLSDSYTSMGWFKIIKTTYAVTEDIKAMYISRNNDIQLAEHHYVKLSK